MTYIVTVGVIDGTPHRQSKPKGNIQRLFWRRDRHCFFMNWMVIVTARNEICFSKPSFVGHLNDATCYRYSLMKISYYKKMVCVLDIRVQKLLQTIHG